ncbi:MAG: hypothetical protein E7L17_14685 [Clostridium sp.]|uniref:hypothetical protein n=1 Tax=Clostridium sp. TaxID=1506 RepID=UPI0029158E17|nr:hypothetical protein [Clostridium sp.]MDU7339347.1 hypothetical protein [Clostridium sp.]
MDNKDIIIRQAAEIFELKDALAKSEDNCTLFLENNAKLRADIESLQASLAAKAERYV